MAGSNQCACTMDLRGCAADAMVSSQTAIYAQGVGLGASKGKEVGKYADGYKGYLNMAQDAVSILLSNITY